MSIGHNSRWLDSPLTVFGLVRQIFPDAQGDVTPQGRESCFLSIVLPSGNAIEVKNSLDGDVFCKELIRIAPRVNRGISFPPIDWEACVLSPPLNGWAPFRRIFNDAVREQEKCGDVLLRYLQTESGDALKKLVFLGLDPERVGESTNDEEGNYVLSLFSQIIEANHPEKRILMANYERMYPRMFHRHLDHLAEKKYQANRGDQISEYDRLCQSLGQSVVGQMHAVGTMANLLVTQSNLRNLPSAGNTNRCFLFVGPTGVGKTELAKAVSKEKEDRYIMFPMNQYANEIDISRFFGASAGYVGSTDTPLFAKPLERYGTLTRSQGKDLVVVKDVVLLFDEFEKAHYKIRRSLLTLFDEGFCELSYVRDQANRTVRYELKQSVIVCTSNLCQGVILEACEQSLSVDRITELFRCANAQLGEEGLPPELMGRLTVIPFGPIPRGECFKSILSNHLHRFSKDIIHSLPCKEFEIDPLSESEVLIYLEDCLYGNGTNIRSLKQFTDKLEGALRIQQRLWGNLSDKKITLKGEVGVVPSLHLSIFLKEIDGYWLIPNIAELPLPM